jgi:MurNAc alpha-1-phosphate uridylyltransferase
MQDNTPYNTAQYIPDSTSVMQVAILAGGLATRLGDLTTYRPKSMIEISGKPFLEYQLDFLKKGGVTNIVICLGHLGDQIVRHFGDGRTYGLTISYSPEESPLGTAGALRRAQHLLDDRFFTMYGDSYLLLDFHQVIAFFNSCNKLALMTVHKNYDRYDKSNTVVEGNLVKAYSKTEKTKDMVYIDYGLNIFNRECLDLIPENQPYSLEELFTRLIEEEELLAYEITERFYEIGSLEGLQEFEIFAKNRLNGIS